MTLTYIYHSCFVAETDSAAIIFDYWRDNAQQQVQRLVQTTEKQVYFVVSHFHEDHFNPDILTLGADRANAPRVLISNDTRKRRRIPAEVPTAVLHADDVYSDEHLTLKAFRSTDVGVSTLVELPGGETLFHAGDLNNWYFPEGEERLKVTLDEMEGLFLSIVRQIAHTRQKVQHVMFPVDPRLGASMLRGPFQWLNNIETEHFYPMHFWGQVQQISQPLAQLQENFPHTQFHLPEEPTDTRQ